VTAVEDAVAPQPAAERKAAAEREVAARRNAAVGQSVVASLEHVRQRLRSHGGDLRVLGIEPDGEVSVEFLGACRGCPALAFTYSAVVHPAIDQTEGVTGVRCGQVRYSAHVARRVADLT
jgi:Fe-S cluster biogenesis protein NfuA